ncbi:hypothetical protein M514_02383 [Trichuris suis]|uniref:Uncharacterized protein n=1 Tax=Trichuris suis TaxID=68888 RepID=A0A085MHL1_9BILA|nr:hypothetical protein M513_02383 [Trichuris suis]KFD60133.1 hypothetical protein M514_02383 [Trichuris suis]
MTKDVKAVMANSRRHWTVHHVTLGFLLSEFSFLVAEEQEYSRSDGTPFRPECKDSTFKFRLDVFEEWSIML